MGERLDGYEELSDETVNTLLKTHQTVQLKPHFLHVNYNSVIFKSIRRMVKNISF